MYSVTFTPAASAAPGFSPIGAQVQPAVRFVEIQMHTDGHAPHARYDKQAVGEEQIAQRQADRDRKHRISARRLKTLTTLGRHTDHVRLTHAGWSPKKVGYARAEGGQRQAG